VHAHVEARGKVPRLEVTAGASVGAGTLDAAGSIDLGSILGPRSEPAQEDSTVRAQLHLEAKSVDLNAFAASAPKSSLGATGDVTLTAQPTGALAARATLDVHGGDCGATLLPPAEITAAADLPPAGLPTASADVVVHEPGVDANVAVHVFPRGGAPVLTFEADGHAPEIERVARVAGLAKGDVHVRSQGSIDFGTGAIGGAVSASVEDFAVPAVTISVAHADAELGGTLSAPTARLEVAAEGLDTGPTRLAAVRAVGRVAVGVETRIRDLDVAAEGEGIDAHVAASLVSLAPHELRVDDATVEGFGGPLAGSIRTSPAGLTLKARGTGLDLARLARVWALPVVAGNATVDVDATISAGSADGRASIGVTGASLYGVTDANAAVDVTVRGRQVTGVASLRVGDVGDVKVRTSALEIGPGRLVTSSPWRKTWGAIAFDGRIDLAKLRSRLPARLVPLDDVVGVLDLAGQVERDSASDTTPGVELTLRTHDLAVSGRRAASVWRIDGIDPVLRVTVDGRTGRTVVGAELDQDDKALVRLDASSNAVPYAQFFSDADPLAALRSTPFDATIDVPARALARLPAPLRPAALDGNLQAHAVWAGAVVEPTLDATVKIAGATDSGVLVQPIDLDLGMHYDGARLNASLAGTVRNARVLDAAATLDARASDILAGTAGAWSGSGRATMRRLSLRTFAPLYDRQVRGTVSGDVSLDGLGRDARLQADLAFDGLQVNGVPFKSGHFVVGADGRALDGMLRFDQAQGFVEGRAHFASRWGRAALPSIDPGQPGSASLVAKKLRAAFLLPFVPSSIATLDGEIDADARATIDPSSRMVRPQGAVTLTDGTLELTTFGGEFHDVAGRLTLTPDGVVRLEDAVAHGLSGTVQAAASARFDAGGLVGAKADVRMPSKDPLPLVFDGVPMGTLDGNFLIAVDRAAQGLDVRVDVPAATVELPTASASRGAQPLGDVDGVQIGVRRSGATFEPIALDHACEAVDDPAVARKSPIRIAVELGRDVRVRRGANLDIHLEGQPSVELSDGTHASGQIRLRPGSTLDVQGKGFEIESGAVTFAGPDPANPQVALTAGWSAPDGTRVYADYAGPLKDAHVKLRSSPAKTQNEILALLVYGSADDDASKQVKDGLNADTSVVAAAAGSAATEQLNQALDGLNRALDRAGLGGGIATKIDTSQVAPRPEVEVQIAHDISLQVAWVLGVPPPTQPDTTLLTLDWHFLRKWSLETTVGDQGTSILNLVWQHRY
jgi:translocation and assembly module TamB